MSVAGIDLAFSQVREEPQHAPGTASPQMGFFFLAKSFYWTNLNQFIHFFTTSYDGCDGSTVFIGMHCYIFP
jgi:hypothetical protein